MSICTDNGKTLRRPFHIKIQTNQQRIKATIADHAAFQADAGQQLRRQNFLPLPDSGLRAAGPGVHRVFVQLCLGKFITGQLVKSVIFLYGILQGFPHRLWFVLRSMDNHLIKVVELGRVGPSGQLRLKFILSLWHQLCQRTALYPGVKGGQLF